MIMAREPFASRLTSIWIGGFFYWLLKGFKGEFESQLNDKYEERNLWTGYIISFVAILLLVYILFIKEL